MTQDKSRLVRFRPETYARARALYPAQSEVQVKPDEVIGYVLDLAERQAKDSQV